jgi:AcrR family transcriptional regulator
MPPNTITRAQIVAAARPVVERFTVTKFAMEDVARVAGIARQTMYKHFSSRDDLLIAIFVEQLNDMSRGLTTVAARKPTADNLVAILESELQQAIDFPLVRAMLDPAIAPRIAELVFGSQTMTEERHRTWFPILESYVEAGVVRSDLDFAATVRWITYQEFWLLTHPAVLTDDAAVRSMFIRQYIIQAFLA